MIEAATDGFVLWDEVRKSLVGFAFVGLLVTSYITFKMPAVEVADILNRPVWRHFALWLRPTAIEAKEALIEITTWRSEAELNAETGKGKDAKAEWATSPRSEAHQERMLLVLAEQQPDST